MARDKTNFGQDWVTKHRKQIMEAAAARKKKQLEELEKYNADKAQRDEAEERSRQEAHNREHWVRVSGRQWTPPTARATPGSGEATAEQGDSAGQSGPRTRRDATDPLAPAGISLGEPLETYPSPEEEGIRSEDGREYARIEDTDDSESITSALDLVLGAGTWGTASPIGGSSNKRGRSNEASPWKATTAPPEPLTDFHWEARER
ncbi:hypothetical protein GP486_006721 [Trichoglossum hirsutum]|uniref:Uncharacterized protein n=1 Tax=Trichoglossum hirsutum TaxID=265104 RepID=A0A9P8L790_9PEZI|nr:hypothetical protein GP486_006721 [Trichoglossum hirsutum]